MTYGLTTVVDALRRYPVITRGLVALFRARCRDGSDGDTAAIETLLADVSGIDDDRILRLYTAVITATLRTNAFVAGGPEALAFKLDSAAVPGLPRPVPYREIWVFSRRVEGIHLRYGPIARGGLRWSDRRDDFRTEVLGLVKAQKVKNTVIVPTGAKGGFYPKLLPPPAASRDAWLAEGTEAYKVFVRALLSLTDNLAPDGTVIPPAGVVCRDAPDPYLVVAADKGTATFSDTANAIALDAGFWLGDAFASGGRVGYDHKAMAITARGAWISVQRHFREIGHDVQTEPTSVVGVGDMSGDVFGNGMLLSEQIRLIAAFDHRHIFLDPTPDAAVSFAERRRLFALPRSSWDDYDRALISPGGGIFPRSQKAIPLTPQVRAALGLDADEVGPSALIVAILSAKVDLLWFGGIGTYVKAAGESNADVGDRANDAHRIDGGRIGAKVVGEGANLGLTQAGRIEYAAKGGRLNTDFIDNSAGVDCSDNEVNIKIALNAEVAAGRLTEADRNTLLAGMTDDVATLVLRDNTLQTQALSIAERGGVDALPGHIRLIELLEDSAAELDRSVEGLATNEVLAQRGRNGRGLERPELAVVMAYAKMAVYDSVVMSNVVDDPLLVPTLHMAFPRAMQARFAAAIDGHRLRRELIATKLANSVVNRGGLTLPFELAEEFGVDLAAVAGAFVAARNLFDLRSLWDAIDAADVPGPVHLDLHVAAVAALRTQMADLLRAGAGMTPSALVTKLRPGIARLGDALEGLLRPEPKAQIDRFAADLDALGAPAAIRDALVRIEALDGAVGVGLLAADLGIDEASVAAAYTDLGAATALDWAKGAAVALTPADPWERLLQAGLVRDFEALRLDLLRRIVPAGGDPVAVARGLGRGQRRAGRSAAHGDRPRPRRRRGDDGDARPPRGAGAPGAGSLGLAPRRRQRRPRIGRRPRAAQRPHQRDRGRLLRHRRLDERAPRGQRRRLDGDDVGIGHLAGEILVERQPFGLVGRRGCCLAQRRRQRLLPAPRQLILDILERGEDGLAIGRDRLPPRRLGRSDLRRRQAAVEDRLRERRADRIEEARPRKQAAERRRRLADRSGQRQVGIVIGDGDADAGVGRGDAAFGRGDVWPPLEQGRRDLERHLRHHRVPLDRLDDEGRRGLSGEHGNGMLEHLTLADELGQVAAGRGDLGLRLEEIGLGRDAGVVPVGRDRQRAVVRLARRVDQRDFGVERADLEEVGRERRLRRQPRIGEVRIARFRRSPRLLDAAPDAPPQVGLPARPAGQAVAVAAARRPDGRASRRAGARPRSGGAAGDTAAAGDDRAIAAAAAPSGCRPASRRPSENNRRAPRGRARAPRRTRRRRQRRSGCRPRSARTGR